LIFWNSFAREDFRSLPLRVKDDSGHSFLLAEIDVFTFFGSFDLIEASLQISIQRKLET
jgi:hypothetical protein